MDNIVQFMRPISCPKCGGNLWLMYTNGIIECSQCQYQGEIEPTLIFSEEDDQ